jgi:hypothetical protein
MSKRKYESIDIMALYAKSDHKKWNAFLTKCLKTHDVEAIKRVLYGIQSGMADAAQSGVVDSKVHAWFFRAQRSLEDTAKKIFREKYPSPLDDPSAIIKLDAKKYLEAKRIRDQHFESFIRQVSF